MIWTIVWAVVILALYAIPGSDLPSVAFWDLFNFDKVAHFLVFTLLVVFATVGFRKQQRVRTLHDHPRRWAFFLSLGYGAILEGLQGMLFDERTSDLLDFVANSAGVLFGLVIFRLVYGKSYM